jgi:sulfite reductase alpha subunit-like flavoprotein
MISAIPRRPYAPTLRKLLINNLDITAIPRRYFFEQCAAYCSDESHKERLLEFADPAHTDEFYDYTSRPRRSILEILADFPTVKFPWQIAMSVLPPLRGRQFSISSGGNWRKPKGFDSSYSEVQLTIALVKYRTVLRKVRQGVCSRYIASLKPGMNVMIKLERGSWSSQNYGIKGSTALDRMLAGGRPILMIAPGTGVAPMRALAWQMRLFMRKMTEKLKIKDYVQPKAVLVFGNRNREKDFLYRQEWGSLNVEVWEAWSRMSREKVYVQDKIREHAAEVWQMLRPVARDALGAPLDAPAGTTKRSLYSPDEEEEAAPGEGFVLVCGSSGKMPIAVRRALVDIFVKEGQMDEEKAEHLLRQMESTGRYLQETW